MSKVWVCTECGNKERFVAYGSLPVYCVVDGNGDIIETEVMDGYPDPDWPEECAECDSTALEHVEEEELNDDNNEQ